MAKQSECMGICGFCLDEYDEGHAPSVKLYRLNRRLMCGQCANECEGDREQSELAYGSD